MALDENNGLKVTTTGVFEDPHGKYSSNILNPKIRIRRHSTSEQFVPIRGEAKDPNRLRGSSPRSNELILIQS